jgi:hypothetical protein
VGLVQRAKKVGEEMTVPLILILAAGGILCFLIGNFRGYCAGMDDTTKTYDEVYKGVYKDRYWLTKDEFRGYIDETFKTAYTQGYTQGVKDLADSLKEQSTEALLDRDQETPPREPSN